MTTTADLVARLASLEAAVAELWKPDTYRNLWADEERLIIDGVDVTMFRGIPAQLGGYKLQSPFVYGDADFAFPQITAFEADKFGRKGHQLRWLRDGAPAKLVPVRDGAYGPPTWKGFISIRGIHSHNGIRVHCDGELSGRLALRNKQPAVFLSSHDIGLLVHDQILKVGIHLRTHRGPKTGFKRDNRGGSTDLSSFTTELLAYTLGADGSSYTVGRTPDGRGYDMYRKDLATIHATVFLGAEGITLDVEDDLSEKPTHIGGTGTDPRGRKWINAFASNLLRGPAAPYPFADNRTFGIGTTNASTDNGGGMTVMHRKLVGHGYLTRAEGAAPIYDDDTADAVRRLQRIAGLPRTGTMDPATWKALFNVTVTGRSLQAARVMPLSWLPAAEPWIYTANGSVARPNPKYTGQIRVDHDVDHGAGVWKAHAERWSDNYLDRVQTEKNYVGTLEFDPGIGLFAGDVGPDTPEGELQVISAKDIREAWNIKVCYFHGSSTVFHVPGVNVSGDNGVTCALDTRARDLATVGQIIARNKESRRNVAREFITSIRRPNAMNDMLVWSEIGGLLDEDVFCPGGRWTRIPIPAGQSGTIERVRFHLRNSRAEFVAGVTASNINAKHMAAVAGSNPLAAGSKWAKPRVQDRLKKKHLFLYTIGQADQPCGIYPGAKFGEERDDDGNPVPTGDPITGDWEDDAGFPFRSLAHGSLSLFIFPDRDTWLQGGQVLYPNQTEGA